MADAYREGTRCLSAGAPNGRWRCSHSNDLHREREGLSAPKTKGDLKEKVKQMIADGGLTEAIGEWVDHIRLYGNAGAHPTSSATFQLRRPRT